MTSLDEPTVFLASRFLEAAFWAEQWGFRPGEWRWVSVPSACFGFRIFSPVFICGSEPVREDTVRALRVAGAEVFVDAHDGPWSDDFTSALWNMPGVG